MIILLKLPFFQDINSNKHLVIHRSIKKSDEKTLNKINLIF